MHAQQPTEHLPPSALDSPPSAGPNGHNCPPTHEVTNQVHSPVGAAACRRGASEDDERPAVVQPHNGLPSDEGSDDDMTQEDMPTEPVPACAELPDLGETLQPVHQQPSPQQSKSLQHAQRELGTRQPLLGHDESAELHQHAVEGASADDDDEDDNEARWEQALEAEMQSLTNKADEHVLGQQCSDAEVIQLDVESTDDLLDVLADAAADTPPARCASHGASFAQSSCHECLY